MAEFARPCGEGNGLGDVANVGDTRTLAVEIATSCHEEEVSTRRSDIPAHDELTSPPSPDILTTSVARRQRRRSVAPRRGGLRNLCAASRLCRLGLRRPDSRKSTAQDAVGRELLDDLLENIKRPWFEGKYDVLGTGVVAGWMCLRCGRCR